MTGRAVSVVVLLVVEAALALLVVLVHYGFMTVYGDVTDTAFEGLTWGLTSGPAGLGLGLVAVVALIGLMLSPRLWMRWRPGSSRSSCCLGCSLSRPRRWGRRPGSSTPLRNA